MARRGNREILEIREESRPFPAKQIGVRLFRLFRGSRNCLGEDFGCAVATLRLCVESSFLSVKSVKSVVQYLWMRLRRLGCFAVQEIARAGIWGKIPVLQIPGRPVG